ncbi:MAG: sulfurtransferase [Candidatus Hydrogenedentes bacterium]|nr:sulfurtransferase [Candidatus Hydrogenedentota bacterium]
MSLALLCVVSAALSASPLLVETDDLAGIASALVVDVRDADAFAAGHIPGAAHLDYEQLSENRDGVNGLLKPMDALIPILADAGLDPERTIVVYGAMDGATSVVPATRVFWVLEYLGYRDVRLLNGGLAKWRAEERPLETGASQASPIVPERLSTLAPREALYATREEVLDAQRTKQGLLVDLRGKSDFTGETKSGSAPKAGHITGAKNLPGSEFLEEPYFTFKAPEQIRALVAAASPEANQPVITYCNTGRIATVGYVAYRIAGFEDVSLYDGSMSEWGLHAECPMSTGPQS